MRLAISNIAWDVEEDDQLAELLVKYAVDSIDIVPGKYFPNPVKVNDNDITKVKSYWADKGIEITGMQSLLFGTQGLNVFGSLEVQETLLEHLRAVCNIAGKLGATRLVFGSPKNRDRSHLSNDQTHKIAVSFFRALGNIAQENGVIICLEPNPACYGANFMIDGVETFDVVKAIKHPAIKMQLDTGAITINNEEIEDLLKLAYSVIGHIHISDPQLAVVGDSDANHQAYAAAIRQAFEDPLISIEMLATPNESHLTSIERALEFVTKTYRSAL